MVTKLHLYLEFCPHLAILPHEGMIESFDKQSALVSQQLTINQRDCNLQPRSLEKKSESGVPTVISIEDE